MKKPEEFAKGSGRLTSAAEKLAHAVESGSVKSREELEKLKREVGSASNVEILGHIENPGPDVRRLLRTKPVRSLSGVNVVAVMSEPGDCPHGRCVMCPRGEDAPQSYTGHEPAAMRGIRTGFDPAAQVRARLDQYSATGHSAQKIELIVMGGTFLSFDRDYQRWFVGQCLSAMNSYPGKADGLGVEQVSRSTLQQIQEANEDADTRCVGMTFETRPDWCDVDWVLGLGGTRVELGVQIADNKVLECIERGHTVQHTVDSTRRLKNAGLKVCYHVMTGLPGSSPGNDLERFKELFEDERFRPDMLKIYPAVVCKGTELHRMWKAGEYRPMAEEETVELLNRMKSHVPEYVRIMRVQRDIPTHQIEAGAKHTNLRQMLDRCRCIRCRQAERESPVEPDIKVRGYRASAGDEYFISAEEDDVVFGFCRLRKCDRNFVRELHVYGEQTRIGKKGCVQHQGIGRQLLKAAEDIADGKVYVTSGIGARNYYRKFGYNRQGHYMVKD